MHDLNDGIRELSLHEWDHVSGGDGDPTAGGTIPPGPDPTTIQLLPPSNPMLVPPGVDFHVEPCADGPGNQWVANDIDEYFLPCGVTLNGQAP